MTTEQVIVLSVGVAVGAGLVLLAALAVARRRRRAGLGGTPTPADLRQMGRRIRQLERIARATEERLNGRMDELRQLLARAEELLSQAHRPATAPSTAAEDNDAEEDDDAPEASPAGGESVSAAPATAAGPLPAILEKQRDQIARLHRQGLEAIDIARKLRLPVGEVELTLKLRRREQEQARAQS